MKYIVTLIWGLILGQVTFYLGTALSGMPYNFQSAIVLGIGISILVYILENLFIKPTKEDVVKAIK